MIVFVIVQDMYCDHGGGASTKGVYSTKEKAQAVIRNLETERDANPRLYKYEVSWFIEEHEIDC